MFNFLHRNLPITAINSEQIKKKKLTSNNVNVSVTICTFPLTLMESMIILKIWMSVVLDVFRHMFYHKCMIILVAVFQNNKESAVFSLDKVYSGIDLCMKIGLNSSMYLYPFYTNLLPPPPPLPLHPLACLFQLFIFISCFMSGSIAVPSIVW